MRRSAVLNGRLNQRDRAQLRGRLDGRKQHPAGQPTDELLGWLRTSLNVDDVSDAERLDLSEFLRSTAHIDLPPDERLRQLAIFLEPDLVSPQPRAWLALDRVYRHAVRLAPQSLWVHHSRAISAKECVEYVLPNDDKTAMRRILNSAWDAANTAYFIDSAEPDVLYLLGLLSYIDTERTLEEALQFFDATVEEDPKHQWALLYRAHCLHDLEKWAEAAAAYGKVDPAHFVGPLTWRYELLLEQRAYCVFRSGDKAAALAQFQRLLDRWIANPNIASGLVGTYVAEVATGEFRDQLAIKYDGLTQNGD